MTKHTEDLIAAFEKADDYSLFPGIIIGLQEEDKVSEVLERRNCFKLLRNMAAHEPAAFVNQLNDNRAGCSQVFSIKSNNRNIDFDVTLFAIGMLEMHKKTSNPSYIKLASTILRLQYPQTFKRFNNCDKSFEFMQNVKESDMLHNFYGLQRFMCTNYGRVKTINYDNEYQSALFNQNKKVFWKVAIPDISDVVVFCFSKAVGGNFVNTEEFLLSLCDVREV